MLNVWTFYSPIGSQRDSEPKGSFTHLIKQMLFRSYLALAPENTSENEIAIWSFLVDNWSQYTV